MISSFDGCKPSAFLDRRRFIPIASGRYCQFAQEILKAAMPAAEE
jgi:hypothetical protein